MSDLVTFPPKVEKVSSSASFAMLPVFSGFVLSAVSCAVVTFAFAAGFSVTIMFLGAPSAAFSACSACSCCCFFIASGSGFGAKNSLQMNITATERTIAIMKFLFMSNSYFTGS